MHNVDPYPMAVPVPATANNATTSPPRLVDDKEVWVYAGVPEQAAHLPPVPLGDWGTTLLFLPREGIAASAEALAAMQDARKWGVMEHLGPEELEGLGEELVVVTGVSEERLWGMGWVGD